MVPAEAPQWQSHRLLLPSGCSAMNLEMPHWNSQRLLLPEGAHNESKDGSREGPFKTPQPCQVTDAMYAQICRIATPFGAERRSPSPQKPVYTGIVPSAAKENKVASADTLPETSYKGLCGNSIVSQTFYPDMSGVKGKTPQTSEIKRPSSVGFSWAGGPSTTRESLEGQTCAPQCSTCNSYTTCDSELWQGHQKQTPNTAVVDLTLKTNKSSMSECSTQIPCSKPSASSDNTIIPSVSHSRCSSLSGSRQSLHGSQRSSRRSVSTGVSSPSVSWVGTSASRKNDSQDASRQSSPCATGPRRGRSKSDRPGGIRPHEIRANWENSLCSAKRSEKGGIRVETIAERSASLPLSQKPVVLKAVQKTDVEQYFLSSLRPGK